MTRWLHWIHFPVLSVMVWSGILIYWANDVYRIGLGDVTLIKFFPEWFYKAFRLDHKLAQGIAWHLFFQWFFILTGTAYFFYTLISGHWRELLPNRQSWADALNVVGHDLGWVKRKRQTQKYNGAQQIIYSGIILFGLASILTGLAIYKPVQLGWLTCLLGGYDTARAIHFSLTLGYILFFMLHLAQVFRAGRDNFLAMVSGYDSK